MDPEWRHRYGGSPGGDNATGDARQPELNFVPVRARRNMAENLLIRRPRSENIGSAGDLRTRTLWLRRSYADTLLGNVTGRERLGLSGAGSFLRPRRGSAQ